MDEKSCVTPGGTSNDFDVQNKLGRKNTHTTLLLTSLRKHHSRRTQHARGQAVMEGGDNAVGSANNDVGVGGERHRVSPRILPRRVMVLQPQPVVVV